MVMNSKAIHLLGIFIILQCILLVWSVPIAQHRRKRQLPCTHPLRLSAPEFFTHCDTIPCTYGSWSSWKRVPGQNFSSVSQSLCESGKAYTEERFRPTTGSGCDQPVRETRRICLPSRDELLIIALGLGGSGNNYDSVNPDPVIVLVPQVHVPLEKQNFVTGGPQGPTELPEISVVVPKGGPQGQPGILAQPTGGPQGTPRPNGGLQGRQKRQIIVLPDNRRCPHNDRNGQICSHIPGIGKRSIDEENFELPNVASLNERIDEFKPARPDVNDEPKPIPFDRFEHGPHLRQRRQTECDNEVQNVLFVLDTSGSIGLTQFNRTKNALAKLTPLFCKQVRFALITFSSYVNLEFCFNCFDNTLQGRIEAQTAIRNAPYRGGRTNTAGTARCICEDIINISCGIDTRKQLNCLDIVFITDGKSNDPSLDVCEEVKCLHNRFGINTYAIGINSGIGFQPSYNVDELKCIDHYSDAISAFQFTSFNDFEDSITNIITRLTQTDVLVNNPGSCYQRDGNLSPTGIPPY